MKTFDPVTLATPLFILTVILEIVLARLRVVKANYETKDTATSLVMGLFVACTTDAWTSVANITYCSLTLHFITSNWQLVCLSLDCCSFPGSHTGERVAAKLNELLASYGIAKDHGSRMPSHNLTWT